LTITANLTGLLSTDKPLIDIDFTTANATTFEQLQDEYAKIFRVESSANDQLRFYASEIPAVNIPIEVQVVR
jgi:hypothetical protein